jgi:fructose-bisphosphate aldolase class II
LRFEFSFLDSCDGEQFGHWVFHTDNPKAFLYQVDPETDKPYKKYYDPRKYLRAAEENMVARLNEAFADLGSKGKSLAI